MATLGIAPRVLIGLIVDIRVVARDWWRNGFGFRSPVRQLLPQIEEKVRGVLIRVVPGHGDPTTVYWLSMYTTTNDIHDRGVVKTEVLQ